MCARLLVFVLLAGCGAAREPLRLEDWLRVGTDPRVEAAAVQRALEESGYRTVEHIEGEGFVALGFVREADERRAVRVITRLGAALALDSHGTRGVLVRDGAVRLVDPGVLDLDGDGRPELVIAREGPSGTCIAIVRIHEDGRVREAPIEVEALAPGGCASAVEDVDGDGRFEVIVELAWPALALSPSEVPALRVALSSRDGGWRIGPMPLRYDRQERDRRRAALAEARARLDVAAASRLGVELAALANIGGAPLASQTERYDDALSGLVIDARERDAIDAVRAHIAAGWGARAAE